MPVDTIDRTGASAGLEQAAVRAGEAVLEAIGRAHAGLCLALVDDTTIRELNRDWRGKDAATDVLSFSQVEGEAVAGDGDMLGDVVVSVDTLRRQAASGGWTEEEELVRLVLHGVLHLVGHDHEAEADARAMRAEEGRVVAALAAKGIACAWEDGES